MSPFAQFFLTPILFLSIPIVTGEIDPKAINSKLLREDPGSSFDTKTSIRIKAWISKAISFNIRTDDYCRFAYFAVPGQCEQIQAIPDGNMTWYAALNQEAGRKLKAVLPDGELAGEHEGILVLDPFLGMSFGHLVLGFWVDRTTEASCELNGGIFVAQTSDCLHVLRKNHCRPSPTLAASRRRRNRQAIKCEIDFLPQVFSVPAAKASDEESASLFAGDVKRARLRDVEDDKYRRQLLQCFDGLSNFAPCPPTAMETGHLTEKGYCHGKDQSRCEQEMLAKMRIPCRIFENCDHGVIIQGSWPYLDDIRMADGMVSEVKRTLKANGFDDGKIVTFNGLGKLDYGDSNSASLVTYPATSKRLIRTYFGFLRRRASCIDSLVVYVTGPALSKMKLLLFDNDDSGTADDSEFYSADELLSDLEGIKAKQIFLVADASFSGHLIHVMRRATRDKFENLQVVTSSESREPSLNYDLTRQFVKTDLWRHCMTKAFQVFEQRSHGSHAIAYDGSRGYLQTTLAGAPCDVRPPFTNPELRRHYFGCQRVSLQTWFCNHNQRPRVHNNSSTTSALIKPKEYHINRTSRR